MIPASVWAEMHCDACGKVALGLRWIEEWQTWLCSSCDPLLAWDAGYGCLRKSDVPRLADAEYVSDGL